MMEMTLSEFLGAVNSTAPAPGGGGVAAYAGALSAALAGMVAHLTVGRAADDAEEQEMQRIMAETQMLQTELLSDVQRDAAAFSAFMDAMHLPKDTEEQKCARKAAMQAALKTAAEAPLSAAKRCAAVFPLALAVVERGNPGAVTDGIIAAILARAALRSALWNVRINLDSIREQAYCTAMRAEITRLERLAEDGENAVLAASGRA